jgi:D-glycero-alpha-D-manno-heptose-7-phosphate kinase
MIITRAPLRISLGGGGTDLPSYYRNGGGFVAAAAISKYVYVAINRTFTDDYFTKYSELERVDTIDEIRHPIIRETLRLHQVPPSLEIVSMADIPSGTGLGSSGTFTVGLLRAVYALQREHVATSALAEEACAVEIDILKRSVGKQDQYIASFGGLTCFEFHEDGTVDVAPILVSNETVHDLEDHLLLFFTGYSRDAERVLQDQRARSEGGDRAMIDNLRSIEKIGRETRDALESGDVQAFAGLMHDHWQIKRGRTSGITNDAIDDWYAVGRANGAIGGKLVGAGAGGFLMFYAEDPARLRGAMASAGLAEVRFSFDHDGATVLLRD